MHVGKELPRLVRGLCLWCQGQSWSLVRECTDAHCPLHAHRACSDDTEADLMAAVRAFCLACAGSIEAVEACAAHTGVGSQPPCPAHPFRPRRGGPVERIRPLPGLGDMGRIQRPALALEPDMSDRATKAEGSPIGSTRLGFIAKGRVADEEG